MIKNIFIIGDSQIAHISGGEKNPGVIKALEYGSHKINKNNYDVNFIWQHSRTAFKVDFLYLESLFKNNINLLGPNSVIVSEFGGMDSALGQYQKHNNMEQVITKYMNETIKFANKYNCKLIFICPWWRIDDYSLYKMWDDIAVLIKKISKENGLPEPIEIMYNVIDRDYEIIDEWKHNTPEDSKRIVDYIILKIGENYNA